MATETAWARKNTTPIEPPYSAPSARLIMKYAPPPLTRVFVAIAESESAVSVVIAFDATTMASAVHRPAFPTTWPKRRNMMTPRIVSVQGVKTPPKVPKRRASESRGSGMGVWARDQRSGKSASSSTSVRERQLPHPWQSSASPPVTVQPARLSASNSRRPSTAKS